MSGGEVPIGKVVRSCSSWNPRKDGTGTLQYIDLSSIDKEAKAIVSVEEHECSDAPSRARQLVEHGDVLVATVRPNLNGVAVVQEHHHGMTASTGYCVLRPKPNAIDTAYLFHWVKTQQFIDRMIEVATGANYPAVSDKKVKASTIPLPPLSEQKRIAGILDAADALRAKRREALAQLDTLLQATFLDMFGDPVTNPKGWETAAIGEHVKVLGGFAFKSADFSSDGLPVIRISNLTGDGIDLDGCARIPEAALGNGLKFRLQSGDTLIAMSGATTGKLGFVPDNLEDDWYLNQRVGAFRVPEESPVFRDYLRALLRSSFYQSHVWNLAGGAAQPNISGKQLESAEIPVPPTDLQQKFTDAVSTLEEQKRVYGLHLAELDTLFASLQQRAFAGEL